MSHPRFQIMSDLHLETPSARPSYEGFKVTPCSAYLALLGDIGHVVDSRMFDFLQSQLEQFEVVFFIMGNHEPYGMSFAEAKATVKAFEERMATLSLSSSSPKLGRFVFLDQTRYDVSDKLTILGCTLFSRIPPEDEESIQLFVSDFSSIENWTIADHCTAFQSDLAWLNDQVTQIMRQEPDREIVVFTHHSPTTVEAASDPGSRNDPAQVQSAFATDLSGETCWNGLKVRLWAFGHTHFNCDFYDPQTGKRVVANQKGYRRKELMTFDHRKAVEIL